MFNHAGVIKKFSHLISVLTSQDITVNQGGEGYFRDHDGETQEADSRYDKDKHHDKSILPVPLSHLPTKTVTTDQRRNDVHGVIHDGHHDRNKNELWDNIGRFYGAYSQGICGKGLVSYQQEPRQLIEKNWHEGYEHHPQDLPPECAQIGLSHLHAAGAEINFSDKDEGDTLIAAVQNSRHLTQDRV